MGTGRHSHRARRHRLDDDDDYAPQHDGRRRWPIVTTLLVVLVLFILGGLYGGWRYIQGQYFIGVQNGNVAIFRGVNQNLAGISLSSLVQRYDNLPVAQVVPSDQAMIHQTITESSLTAAQSLVGQIQSGVTSCHQKWQAAGQLELRGSAVPARTGVVQGEEDQDTAEEQSWPAAGHA